MMNHIAVIATGGTIASTQSDNGVTAQLSAAEILQASGLTTSYDLTVRSLFTKDSSALTLADLDLLQQAVEEELATQPAGIIVLHGTDTLESTALWLTLTSSAPLHHCPVILTGAIYAADDACADGPKNLQGALRLIEGHSAGTPIPGVSVFFAGTLWDPWGLTKVSTDQPAAFAGPRTYCATQTAPLPLPLPLRPTPQLAKPSTPRVPLVAVDVDDSGDSVAAIVHDLMAHSTASQEAIILCGLGSGNLPPAMAKRVQELKEQYPELLWLLTTRVPGGPVTPSYDHAGGGAQLIRQGIVFAGYLKAAQLRILTMTLLAAGFDAADIRKLFANWDTASAAE